MKQMRFGRVFYRFFMSVMLVGGLTGCEDRVGEEDSPSGKDGLVPVTLRLDFDSEADGYEVASGSPRARLGLASGSPRARLEGGNTASFEASLTPYVSTRTDAILTPDALYNLEIRQYNSAGVHMAGATFSNVNIGQALELKLQASDDCQLVIVARGDGNTVKTDLGTRTLQKVQEVITADSVVISKINPELQADMNKMPYILHLEHVKVVQNTEGGYSIQSPEGAYDVRLRLKRLAARLKVTWAYSVKDFDMKQVLIQSVPLEYAVVASPDAADGTYPSIVKQFTTVEVPNVGNGGTYECWVPANARGTSATATSDALRTKANAPQGSVFINFVAVNQKDPKKKLDYRVYLGGRDSKDFNVLPNTNYNYTVNFSHTGIPTGDGRVTYIDPIPASESNDNLLPTANCFMVAPGSAFCFDPFTFRQNGSDITNDKLVEWCKSGGIKSVKLLWQTKERGDVGDPVMGIANSDTDHTNIVDVKRMDNSTITVVPATAAGQCRIYCRVAANTSGGSGVIAAYDGDNGTGNILWSWHVWVTDYHPDATGTETVLDNENKRKLKLVPVSTTDGTKTAIMMDRNLGAYGALFNTTSDDFLVMSRTNGFHYQKGRKDPFPSSYTTQELPSPYRFTLSEDAPPKHLMNRYQPNGIKAIVPKAIGEGAVSLQMAYRNPVSMANFTNNVWCTDNPRPAWSVTKSIHDPCPEGWRVPQRSEVSVLVNRNRGKINANNGGGMLLNYDGSNNKTYIRFTGYPPTMMQLNSVGEQGYITIIETRTAFTVYRGTGKDLEFSSKEDYDAHTTRCVQEKIE